MVTILPQRQTPGNAITSALRDAFTSTAVPAAQQQYQRGQLQKALESVRGLANDPNATPYDLASTLISATAGIPGAERYVGPLFESLSRTMQAKAATGQGMQAEGALPEEISGEAPRKKTTREEVERTKFENLPEYNYPGKGRPERTQLAPEALTESGIGPEKTGLMQVPAEQNLPKGKFITPAMTDFLVSQELMAGGTGERTKARIDLINQQLNLGRKLTEEDRDWLLQNQELERAREQKFSDFAEPLIEKEFGDIAPLEMNRFRQYAKNIDAQAIQEGKFITPSDLYEKSRARLNDYLKYKGRLEGTPKTDKEGNITKYEGGAPERPTIMGSTSDRYKTTIETLREQVKPLVLMGEADEVRRILASKKYMFDEIEDAINPLSSDQIKEFRSIGRTEGPALGRLRPQAYQEARPKNIDKLEKGLEKSLNQNTSLILLKREAERLGYDTYEFTQALKRLQNKGYQMSPQQTADLPNLEKPSTDFLRKIFG